MSATLIPSISSGPPPGLPPIVLETLQRADAARRDGRTDDAIDALASGLDALRAGSSAPSPRARMMLALTLVDALMGAAQRERARRVLLDECGHAERAYQLTRLAGPPDRAREAAAARLQLRDRAAQIELLGREAPEIEIEAWIQGEPTTLGALRGRVVLLEFWATWCRPCLAMFPKLKALQQAYAAAGLDILALTRYSSPVGGPGATPGPAPLDRSSIVATEREQIRAAIADRVPGARVGIAPDGRLQARFGAGGVPTLVLIDRRGLVRQIVAGGHDTALESAIRACIAEAPPA